MKKFYFLLTFIFFSFISVAQRTMTFAGSQEFADGDVSSDVRVGAIDDTHFILLWKVGSSSSADLLARIAEIDTTNNDAITYGSVYTIETDSHRYPNILVMNESTAVLFYEKDDTDDIGTAALISFDISTKVINSAFADTALSPGDVQFAYPKTISAAKINDSQFVVTYVDSEDGDKGVAKVGTISGTELTFGSEQVFDTDAVKHLSITQIDPSTIVIAYEADNGSSNGTYDIGETVIGHISGDSIVWDGPFAFLSSNFFDVVGYTDIAKIAEDKIVVIYELTEANAGHGYAQIGTITGGNSISFGSLFEFEDTQRVFDISVEATYENEFIIAYNGGSSSYDDGENDSVVIMGEASGSDITYGTKQRFLQKNEGDDSNLAVLNNAKVVLAFVNEGFSDDPGEISILSIPLINPISWDGESSTAWETASNWDSDEVPNLFDNIVIPDESNDPVISTNIAISRMEIESNAILNVSSGSLKINSELILDGTLDISSGASLIPLGNISGAGSATIDRNTTFGVSDGKYSVIGSPVVGDDTDALGSVVYSYDETVAYDGGGTDGANRFISVASPETMVAGKAYFSANTGDITFDGVPNTGSIDVSLVYDESNDGGSTNAGFNLVSNPYAAAISYDDFVAANDDIDGTVYLWDDGGSDLAQRSNSDYITANNMGASGGSSRSGDWDDYLRSSQGFFVKATTAGTLHFTSSMMDIGNNSDAGYFRKAIENLTIRFSLSNENSYNDILIGFSESATNGIDRTLDAYKIKGNNRLQLYSKLESSELAIQALPLLTSERKIDLGFDISESGNYTFSIENPLQYNFEIYLVDHLLNRNIDLNQFKAYSFESSSVKNSDRFSLVFSPSKILTLESENEDNRIIIYSDTNRLKVLLDKEVNNAVVKIYNLNGKLVKQVQDVDFIGAKWATTFSEKGLFIMTIQSENILLVKKFFN